MKPLHLLFPFIALMPPAQAFSQELILLKCEQISSSTSGRWSKSIEINSTEKKILVSGKTYTFTPKSEERIVEGKPFRTIRAITEWSANTILWKDMFPTLGDKATDYHRLDRITGELQGPYSSGPCQRAEKLF